MDIRKSFEGLSAWIHNQLKQNPMAPVLFVFRNKRADRIKCLYWDRNGFALWYKRLKKGTFKGPRGGEQELFITPQEVNLLIDGADISKLKRLRSLSFSDEF